MADVARPDAVTSEIIHYMRDMISSGQWPVGSKIPSENQLRKRLKVSRTSLRSAIMQLAALNVLKARQGIGTFVIGPLHDETMFEESGKSLAAKKEIVQILEFLKIVAPTAIYIEMSKFNKCFKGLERQLVAALDEQRELAVHDRSKFMQSCFNFHKIIFNGIVNEFVKDSVLEAIRRLQLALSTLQPTISSQVILTLHQKLIFAIVQEDPKLARRVLKKLYTYLTAHDYLRNLARTPRMSSAERATSAPPVIRTDISSVPVPKIGANATAAHAAASSTATATSSAATNSALGGTASGAASAASQVEAVPAKRKRGRPRKNPLPEQATVSGGAANAVSGGVSPLAARAAE